MSETLVIWLAVVGGVVAGACALSTIWLLWDVRRRVDGPPQYAAPPQPRMIVMQPQQQPQMVVYTHPPATPPATFGEYTGRTPLTLEGNYPQLATALGSWMQTEPDATERVRIARDLGSIGDADAARALLDGVRTGVLTPTIASDNLVRGGFEAGITVAAALADPEPRVRALATSLVGRAVPLNRIEVPRIGRSTPPSPPVPATRPTVPAP